MLLLFLLFFKYAVVLDKYKIQVSCQRHLKGLMLV